MNGAIIIRAHAPRAISQTTASAPQWCDPLDNSEPDLPPLALCLRLPRGWQDRAAAVWRPAFSV